MEIKPVIRSQYQASLSMLRQAIQACPDAIWTSSRFQNSTWQLVFHTLFYTHLYLGQSEDHFVRWEKHREEGRSLGWPDPESASVQPYSKDEMLEYLQYCSHSVGGHVEALDLEGPSGFDWLPFNKLELQFYNIRHIMQHTGEMAERIGARGEAEVKWVGMGEA